MLGLRRQPFALERFRADQLEQLCSHDGGDEERDEDHPVERFADGEAVVRQLEKEVDQDERGARDRESEYPPPAHAAAQHREQIDQDHVRLVDVAAGCAQHESHGDQDRAPDQDRCRPSCDHHQLESGISNR